MGYQKIFLESKKDIEQVEGVNIFSLIMWPLWSKSELLFNKPPFEWQKSKFSY